MVSSTLARSLGTSYRLQTTDYGLVQTISMSAMLWFKSDGPTQTKMSYSGVFLPHNRACITITITINLLSLFRFPFLPLHSASLGASYINPKPNPRSAQIPSKPFLPVLLQRFLQFKSSSPLRKRAAAPIRTVKSLDRCSAFSHRATYLQQV